jgi:hypothetical protein
MENDKIKVWFNPEKNWYEVFYKGELLPNLGKVIITDYIEDKRVNANIDFIDVDIVNEKPTN